MQSIVQILAIIHDNVWEGVAFPFCQLPVTVTCSEYEDTTPHGRESTWKTTEQAGVVIAAVSFRDAPAFGKTTTSSVQLGSRTVMEDLLQIKTPTQFTVIVCCLLKVQIVGCGHDKLIHDKVCFHIPVRHSFCGPYIPRTGARGSSIIADQCRLYTWDRRSSMVGNTDCLVAIRTGGLDALVTAAELKETFGSSQSFAAAITTVLALGGFPIRAWHSLRHLYTMSAVIDARHSPRLEEGRESHAVVAWLAGYLAGESVHPGRVALISSWSIRGFVF
jgi:hypothetical protein